MDPLARVMCGVAVALVAATASAAEPSEQECKAVPGDRWSCPRSLVLQWFRSHAKDLPICEADLKREKRDRETDSDLHQRELAACDRQVTTLEKVIATPPPVDDTWRIAAIVAGTAIALFGGTVAALQHDKVEIVTPAAIVGVGGLALAIVAAVDP